ncbi:DUF3017 domain-containing protein [Corynebacterium sp. LK2510]|uniref:DUF3017 domain-containing protein n=1 Tax=Corynebacterium sp. LK2510 TaxID=3110472 RepID=UPI0034CF4777
MPSLSFGRLRERIPGPAEGLSLDNPHDLRNPPSRLPLRLQQAMVVVFVAGFALSALFSATEHWRRATFTLGAALVWLALMRYTCDSRVIGLVAVRSRRTDAIFCAGVGLAMMGLAGSVDALGS